MLKQRILTAVVLLAFLLPALLVKPAWPFALLVGIAIAAAGWEWARLNDAGGAAIAIATIVRTANGQAWLASSAGSRMASSTTAVRMRCFSTGEA